jgi:3D (Asp-Asp-Asp) domain-containing protein
LGAALVLVATALSSLSLEGCASADVEVPRNARRVAVQMVVTGYDNGPESCGWRRNWYGRPVYDYGPLKGKPKQVGVTASGVRAQHGTIAADTRYYPIGTVMYIPGYGYGVVEDRGGDIKGPARIDLWFRSRNQAFQWGRRQVKVTVYVPNRSGSAGQPSRFQTSPNRGTMRP